MNEQTDGQRAREEAAQARTVAAAAVAAQVDIVHRLDNVQSAIAQVHVTQSETRADLLRIEIIAREARDQAKATNGRVNVLELWRAELKGIAQGSGGTGRLLLYMLSAAAGTGTIIVTAMKILER